MDKRLSQIADWQDCALSGKN